MQWALTGCTAIKKISSDGLETDYMYDLLNHLTQAAGSGANGTYTFAYDNLGRLTQTSTQYSFLTNQIGSDGREIIEHLHIALTNR